MSSSTKDGWVGMSLGGMAVHVAKHESSGQLGQALVEGIAVPPAVVFSPHAKPLFSETCPLPLSGAGLPWPPTSSEIDIESKGCARVPLAHIWGSLFSEDRTVHVASQRVLAEEALAIAARGALNRGTTDSKQPKPKACIVIPNELQEARQQDLLDAFRRKSMEVSLLWRPVAAAFEWLNKHGHAYAREVREETVVGSFLSIHLGADGFEGTLLDLILRPGSDGWILPARRRPKATVSCFSISAGRELLNRAVDRACTGNADHRLQGWRALWASPVTRGVLEGGGATPPSEFWGVRSDFEERLRQNIERTMHSAAGLHDQGDGAGEWLSNLFSTKKDYAPVLGASVSGCLANCPVTNSSLGMVVVESLFPGLRGKIDVEGTAGIPVGILARGAAIYAARRAEGKATYLDTLPKIEVVIEERAQPVWKSLLNEAEQYVDGGHPWCRDPDFGGLMVPARSKELALSVLVEPETMVRRVRFSFPDPPKSNVKVKLRVEMEPAGGNARVVLKAEKAGGLGRGDVLLDWSRAEVLDQDRKGLLSKYPRKCPQVQPMGNWAGDHYFRTTLERLVRTHKQPSEYELEELKGLLKATRPVAYSGAPRSGLCRAVNSNGQLHPSNRESQALLDSWLNAQAGKQLAECAGGKRFSKSILRVLGYACANGDAVQRLVKQVLWRRGIGNEEALFLAGCIRHPEHAAQLILHLLERLEHEWGNFNEVLKVVGHMMQWLEDGLEGVSPKQAERLIFLAREQIACGVDRSMMEIEPPGQGTPPGRFKFIERGCLVLIAFLLRKRIDQDSFLAPDSDEAIRLKAVLMRALELVVTRPGMLHPEIKPLNGVVQVEVLLRRVIKYIDREGTGAVVSE